uniref:Uncharacterized protein n=1 Tax=Anguilla anguilla TaxID=7936 RepID=A0A0E9U130_ANGAN
MNFNTRRMQELWLQSQFRYLHPCTALTVNLKLVLQVCCFSWQHGFAE